MSGFGKRKKLLQVVRVRQIVRDWRTLVSAFKAAQILFRKLLSSRSCLHSYVSDDAHFDVVGGKHRHRRSLSAVPPDVPSGHLAVYVGRQCRKRFVIRAAYLSHPVFRSLLERAEEEFGYAQQGGLVIPCDELLFEHILSLFSQNDHAAVRHIDLQTVENNFCNEWLPSLNKDSRPIPHSSVEE